MRKSLVVLTLLIGCTTLCAIAANNAHIVWPLTPQKIVTLTAPSCWTQTIKPAKKPRTYKTALTLTDRCNNETPPPILQLAAGNVSPALAHSQKLRQVVQSIGLRFLPHAKEKHLSIKILKSEKLKGFYYTLTNKQAQPNKFLYMTQGVVNLDGKLLFLFGYFHHKNDAASRKQVLTILKSLQLKTSPVPVNVKLPQT